MLPLFIDESSKDFIMKLAGADYSLGTIRLELTKLRLKMKSMIEPVNKITINHGPSRSNVTQSQ